MSLTIAEREVTTIRQQTPGHEGWEHVATGGAPNKYFMVSVDCHATTPPGLWEERIDEQYRHRLPRVEIDDQGTRWLVNEGHAPQKIRDVKMDGEDQERQDRARGLDMEERLRDDAADGVDAELIFPGGGPGLSSWATPDVVFSTAMCKVWNDWAWETFGPYDGKLNPGAMIAPADVEGSIAEVRRCANMGFRAIAMPERPHHGDLRSSTPHYNHRMFDPLWAEIQDVGLPMVIHVGTGKDPRAAKGDGGAVVNYAVHALGGASEPTAIFCASGLFDRFPGLRFANIESGIGWVPWLLHALDEAYHKHHFWSYPKLSMLPSEYYKKHGASAFMDDPIGLRNAREDGLINNYLWSNDYPHHEGTWPHSAASIERNMGNFTDHERARILGLNAAELFKIEVPAHQQL